MAGNDVKADRTKATDLAHWFEDRIKAETGWKEALAALVRHGCDADTVLLGLYTYACVDPQAIAASRRRLAQKAKRLLHLAQSLSFAAKELPQVTRTLEEVGVVCHFAPEGADLDNYADFLTHCKSGLFRRLTSRRFNGRLVFLTFVAQYILKTTGKPHFRELSCLHDAVQESKGKPPRRLEEDALEKRVRRSPKLCEEEMEAIHAMIRSQNLTDFNQLH